VVSFRLVGARLLISRNRSILIVASVCALAAVAQARAEPRSDAARPDVGFELLRIGGELARWHPRGHEPQIVIRYRVADRPMTIAGAVNCGSIVPPDQLLQRSRLTADDLRRALAEAARIWRGTGTPVFMPADATGDADLIIGAQGEPGGIAFTNLSLDDRSIANDGTRRINSAQVCLNPSMEWKMGFDGNLARRDLTFALAHEFGHVLGLDHPGARGHLMSFRYLEDHRSPTAGDRAGLAALYGAADRAENAQAAPPTVTVMPAAALTR